MSKEQTPFMAQTALLDGYIKSEHPASDPAALEIVISVLREKPELRQYFFRSQPTSAWAEILWSSGFLAEAPSPITEDGKIPFPYWDAQEFLLSVARDAPAVVIKHLRNLKGHAWYRGRAILAISFLPTESITDIMPTVLEWLADKEFLSIAADSAYSAMVELSKKKNVASLDIFRCLTTPQPPLRVKELSGGYIINTEAVSVLPDFRWGRELDNTLKLLRDIDARQVALILEEQLCASLRIEADAKKASQYEFELSSWWRAAIESTSQDLRGDFKDELLEDLRDTLEFLASHDREITVEILSRYSEDPHEILRRLRLHILSRFPSEFKDDVIHDLLIRENYDDTGIHHEFFMLLKHGFPVLSTEERERVVKIVIEGPPKENVERFIEWVSDINSDESETAVENYVKRWTRDRLSMISEHLDEKRLSLLNSLTRDVGEPEHPDFTSWTGEAFAVADVSPLPVEQLAMMAPMELLTFLAHWQPEKNRMFGPEVVSYRGLGKSAASAIEGNPLKYREHFVDIGLLRPEFAYALLGEQRLDNEHASRMSEEIWHLYFDLCDAILANESLAKDMDRKNEINWRDVRSAIVTLIENGLKKRKEERAEISLAYFSRTRDILVRLTDDPDPVFKEEDPTSESFTKRDPATSALNHVRPKAVGVLIERYCHYVAEANQATGRYGETEGPGPNRIDPEIEEVLNFAVKSEQEPSLAVHSVFGRTLTVLYWLNRKWVEEHLAEIFPEDEHPNAVSYFVAAWDSYVVFNRPHYKDLFDLLYPKYVRAIDNLRQGLVTQTHLKPDRGLAAHVLGKYLWGNFELRSDEGQSSLLAQFFNKAPADTRSSAIWILWNTLKSHSDEGDRLWPKVREIWRWRVDEASSQNHSSDFDGEFSWFPHMLEFAPETETITSMWPLLEGILPHIGRGRRFGTEWEEIEKYLLREMEREPLKVVRFYRLMHEVAGRPAWFLEHNERKILEAGASRKESRDETLSLIDLIGRLGDLSYRDIYEKYAR